MPNYTRDDVREFRQAVGYIVKFADLFFDRTFTNTGFGTCRIQPLAFAMPGNTVLHGIQVLAGGRVFDPWMRRVNESSTRRAPIAYPEWRADFIYRGSARACLMRYESLLGRLGQEEWLRFSYGRNQTHTDFVPDANKYGEKECLARFLTCEADIERGINTSTSTNRTHFIVRCIWQQTGDFSKVKT